MVRYALIAGLIVVGACNSSPDKQPVTTTTANQVQTTITNFTTTTEVK